MAANTPLGESVQHPIPQEHVAPDHLHDILASDASKGAAVHSFSPESSPQAKAAATSEVLIPRIVTDTEPIDARGVSS